MNKILVGLAALTFASATTASASTYIGGSVGSGGAVHYQTDLSSGSAVRYSLNLYATNFNFGQLSVGASVDYLTDLNNTNINVNTPNTTFGGLTPYYGFGLGAGVGVGSVTGVSVYPHVLGGIKYQLSDPLSIFGELDAGINVAVSNAGTGVGFGSNARIGVMYKF
ncbi:hypothetical protein FNU79_06330 [Deinococcus detaillensis]|uniref:Porin family protein n=1 Tax=Deinococcus detaillensis TaxID=2592048 RepID=A0A553V2Z7_9DEIO|nr:hypothetical protein [Deinococcus detaillensis]TSA86802.1 hypothetical protein FNU79_06330 [Deinococcus detaillensis]